MTISLKRPSIVIPLTDQTEERWLLSVLASIHRKTLLIQDFYPQVKVGDTLDFILGEDKDMDTVNLKRVIFKKVIGETKDTEKYKVILRTWKSLHLPKKDVYRE